MTVETHPFRPFLQPVIGGVVVCGDCGGDLRDVCHRAETHAEYTARVVQERLDYLRGQIEAERISYSEIDELQSLAEHIEPGDVVLLEWAGVPEGELRALDGNR